MANRVLGIEVSKNSTKIVEAAYGRRLRIFNFAVIESGGIEPERRVEQLQHMLRLRGFESREAVIAVSGAGMEHRLLTLPPLSDRELHFVMAREAKKLGAAESLWAYEQLKTKEELGIKKNQILLVTADQGGVQSAHHLLTSAQLKIQQITTVPDAILNLVRQAGISKRDAAKLVVHFGGIRVHVVFIQDGVLMLSRDFPFEYESVSRDEQVRRLVTEVKRSLLFFKQNFPQAKLHEILYSGDSDIIVTLSKMSQEFGLETNIIGFEDLLDPSGFRGEWDEFRFHIPAMAAAIGAAWRKTPGSGINLIAGKTAVPGRAKLKPEMIARVAAALVLVMTLLASGYYYLELSKTNSAHAAFRLRNIEVQPKVEQAAALQQQRAIGIARTAFIRHVSPATNWLEAFRSLTFVVPETATFESIQITSSARPVMTIRGQLLAPNAAEANADFNRFFNSLRGLPLLSGVAMSKPLTVSNEAGDAATQASLSAQSRISFEVRCELRSNN